MLEVLASKYIGLFRFPLSNFEVTIPVRTRASNLLSLSIKCRILKNCSS